MTNKSSWRTFLKVLRGPKGAAITLPVAVIGLALWTWGSSLLPDSGPGGVVIEVLGKVIVVLAIFGLLHFALGEIERRGLVRLMRKLFKWHSIQMQATIRDAVLEGMSIASQDERLRQTGYVRDWPSRAAAKNAILEAISNAVDQIRVLAFSCSGTIRIEDILQNIPDALLESVAPGAALKARIVMGDLVSQMGIERFVWELPVHQDSVVWLTKATSDDETLRTEALREYKRSAFFKAAGVSLAKLKEHNRDENVRIYDFQIPSYFMGVDQRSWSQHYLPTLPTSRKVPCPTAERNVREDACTGSGNCEVNRLQDEFETIWRSAHITLDQAIQRREKCIDLLQPVILDRREWLLFRLEDLKARLAQLKGPTLVPVPPVPPAAPLAA